LAVAANQLTQYLVLAIAAIFGAVSGILIGRYQGNQLNLAILRQELDSERKNQETMRVFLGDVAHELKTPLTVIRGYSEMLERSSDAESADTAKPIKRIAAEVVRMEKLLAELLQLAQVREGAAQKPRELNLSEMLQAQLDDLSALQRGRKVTSDIEQVPAIMAPQLLIEMLLNNVFSNIRKHTEFDDSVHATLRAENDEVVLAVEDEGPGLPALLLEKQSSGELQRFTSIRNNQVEGQGLGLAIIRNVAEQIGAKVHFEKSERLGGLRVEFRFVNRAPQNGPAKKFGSNKLLK
jgi:signal transduction histidine kinase